MFRGANSMTPHGKPRASGEQQLVVLVAVNLAATIGLHWYSGTGLPVHCPF
jgi:hypothetical protein